MSRRSRRSAHGWLACGVLGFAAVSVIAGGEAVAQERLWANECVVVYNAAVSESAELAQYYAMRRSIPMGQLIALRTATTEEISRVDYERTVREPIRRRLRAAPFGGRVRCLVTVFGLPLKVGPRRPTASESARARVLDHRLRNCFASIESLVEQMARAGGGSRTASKPRKPQAADLASPATYQAYESWYFEQLQALVARHGAATSGTDGADQPRRSDARTRPGVLPEGDPREAARRETFAFIERAEGIAGLLGRAPKNGAIRSAASAVRIRALRQRLAALDQESKVQTAWPSSATEFDAGIETVRQAHGLFGVAAALNKRIRSLRGTDSASSLDSELAMLFSGDYDVSGWMTNPLRLRQGRPTSAAFRPVGRTLMISRLDAENATVVRRMIDDALAAEATGLNGMVYVDARGLHEDDGLGPFDRDLRIWAERARAAGFRVRLDDRPELFGPGDCPRAALYCGWYSLRNYVDAFEFERGAVAVHIASFEAVSLRDNRRRYWCKNLLADGAAATFGATAEPFLESFPLPSEFFGRLTAGETLVEAFFQTKPYNSWRLVLLGDPLYRPFAKKTMRTEANDDR